MSFGIGGGFGQPVGGSGAPGMGGMGGVDARQAVQVQGAVLTQSFFWMFAGLLLTAAVAALTQFNPALMSFTRENFLILILGQFALSIGIQAGIRRFNPIAALGAFFVYAASLGLTVGLIVSAYTGQTVVTAFLSAGAMFGGAALYGYTTKRSLTGIGGIAFMLSWGLIVALAVNFFIGSGPFGYILAVAGVILFTIITAYVVQRLATGELVAYTGSVEKAAVLGAIQLYIAFINIFLFLLRIFGDRD